MLGHYEGSGEAGQKVIILLCLPERPLHLLQQPEHLSDPHVILAFFTITCHN